MGTTESKPRTTLRRSGRIDWSLARGGISEDASTCSLALDAQHVTSTPSRIALIKKYNVTKRAYTVVNEDTNMPIIETKGQTFSQFGLNITKPGCAENDDAALLYKVRSVTKESGEMLFTIYSPKPYFEGQIPFSSRTDVNGWYPAAVIFVGTKKSEAGEISQYYYDAPFSVRLHTPAGLTSKPVLLGSFVRGSWKRFQTRIPGHDVVPNDDVTVYSTTSHADEVPVEQLLPLVVSNSLWETGHRHHRMSMKLAAESDIVLHAILVIVATSLL
jgi:hypothetical protein